MAVQTQFPTFNEGHQVPTVSSSGTTSSVIGKTWAILTDNRAVNYFSNLSKKFSDRKKAMELPCPGPFEALHRESRNVSLTNLLFEGGKLELAKVLSNNFQITQSYTLSPGNTPSTYHFGAAFAGKQNFMHGMIDNKGDLQGKCQYAIGGNILAKGQIQLSNRPGYSVLQLETDYLGDDYTVNLKGVNPNVFESSGIYTLGYLQSVTKHLSLGVEGVYQKPTADIEESGISFVGRYAKKDWIATATLQNMSAAQVSYFRKVNESTELSTELQALFAGPQLESLGTIGCKMDYHMVSIRAQFDTAGRAAMYLEHRLMARTSLLLSGEIDHVKGRSRFGVGLNFEA